MTLEDITRDFRLGYKIADEAVRDYGSQEKKHTNTLHIQRLEAFSSNPNLWEALGYLSGMTKNTVRHPIKMYSIFFK